MNAFARYSQPQTHRAIPLTWALLTALLATPAIQAGTLSQIPLFLGSSAMPNVMVGLDNSSSMEAEIVSAAAGSDYYYVFPSEVKTTSTGNLQVLFPDGLATAKHNIPPLPQYADARAAAANRSYFDPAQQYVPWVSYGNITFGNADPKAAPWYPISSKIDPKATWKTLNLTVNQPEMEGTTKSPLDFYAFTNTDEKYIVKVPAGTRVKPSFSSSLSKNTGCTTANKWCTTTGDGTSTDQSLGISYFPATFYLPQGTPLPTTGYSTYKSFTCSKISATGWDNKTKWDGYEIRPTCFGDSTEYDKAIQNFANWFTYYRRRKLAAMGSIGTAFKGIDSVKLGVFGINQRNATYSGLVDLSNLTQDNKTNIDNLFAASGLPHLGVYYYDFKNSTLDKNSTDPCQLNPSYTCSRWAVDFMGKTLGGNLEARCQKSVGILVSDGIYDDTVSSGGPGNADGGYPAPIGDDVSDTMADFAMKYYLGTGFNTKFGDAPIPASCTGPSASTETDCWNKPHMNFYVISMGLRGKTFDPDNPKNAFTMKPSPVWPDDDALNKTRSTGDLVDDIWHATVNGHGLLFNASRPADIRDRLLDIVRSIIDASGSAAGVSSDSSYATDSNQIYQATFDTASWTGELAAYLLKVGVIDTANPVWKASQKLPGKDQRKIYTRTTCSTASPNPTNGVVEFTWNNLYCDQQTILKDGGPAPSSGNRNSPNWGQLRLNYLRGDTTNEVRNGGEFRNRLDSSHNQNLLGDIVNSAPTLASAEDFGYDILPGDEGSLYVTDHIPTKKKRAGMVYVGSNDGMLHGFSTSTGVELFAYIPLTSYYPVENGGITINNYTAPNYSHRYFVDGTPKIFDAYVDIGKTGTPSWQNILVGTTGAGGRSIFAINVTDPSDLGAGSVLWELSGVTDDVLPDLGYTLAEPVLVRTHSTDNPWVLIVANGYNSPNGKAELFIIDPATGTILKTIDTLAAGNSGDGGLVAKNGLSTPIAVDIEQDRIADYVYAGDLLGNLWKFDLTDTKIANWKVAYSSGKQPAPIFVACANHSSTCSDANRQPITSKPQVGAAPLNMGGMLIYFGTGRYMEDKDKIISDTEQVQTFYGIWDQNTLTSNDIVSQSDLVAQTITDNNLVQTGSTLRITSSNAVDYSLKKGWYLDLKGTDGNGNSVQGERVVSTPVFHDGRITFASFIPTSVKCDSGGKGWIMEIDALTGNRIQGVLPAFDINNDNKLTAANDLVTVNDVKGSPSGIAVDGVPSATHIMRDSNYIYRINSMSSGEIKVNRGLPDPNRNSRVSWRQIR